MPDEVIVEEEITEQETKEDPEAIAAFESDEEIPDSKDTEKKEPEKKPEKKEKKKAEKEPEPDKKDSDKKPDTDKKEPEKEEKKDEETSLEDQLKKRVKDLNIEDDETPEDPPKKKGAKKKEPGPVSPSKLTKEQISDYLGGIDLDDLPDDEVIIGDRTVDLKKYRDEDPEAFDILIITAGMIAKRQIEAYKESVGKAETVSPEAFAEQQETLRDLLFWNEVAEVHSDWRKVTNSKEFAETMKLQSKGIQTLAKNLPSPEDAIMVIDLHKKRIGKESVDKHDDKARGEKRRHDDLHSDTTGRDSSPAPEKSKKGGGNADEEAFDSDIGD